MKSKEKTKSTLIRDALALFLITLISGLALSFIFEITKAPIKEQEADKILKANQAVYVEASTFETDEELTSLAAQTDMTSLSEDYEGITVDEVRKALDANGKQIGYNITVTTNQGYASPITLVIGYSSEGAIKGLQYTAIGETAGLGMNAKKPEFINQYLNKQVANFTVTKTGATSDDQIDAISGATITSKAVTNAVNAGMTFLLANASDLGGGNNE